MCRIYFYEKVLQREVSRCGAVNLKKRWSKTMGVLAVSSGESELAAVVRAATEGLGLQSNFRATWTCVAT